MNHRVRRWLVVSYFSKIDGMACAQHVDDRLSYLLENGIEPVMLTGICGAGHESLAHVRVPSAAPSGIRYELRHVRRKSRLVALLYPLLNLLLFPLYALEKLLIDLDSQWWWFPLAASAGGRLCKEHKPELIYSTGGAASAHMAAFFVSRFTGLPWIAEFQDPLVFRDWKRSKRAYAVYAFVERVVCARASAVIYLTEAAREHASKRTELGDKGYVIYAGAEPVTPEYGDSRPRCRDIWRIAHFGSLGGSRNLSVFLRGLEMVLSERPELAEIVRFDQYGTSDRVSCELIDNFPVSGVVRNRGRVSRNEALSAMTDCDVLLLIQNTEDISAETIPSKTYEYFHMAKPILGLLHRNPELSRMLAELGHRPLAADDPVAVKQGLMEMVYEWQEGRGREMAISPYTVKAAVGRLIAIADSILKN